MSFLYPVPHLRHAAEAFYPEKRHLHMGKGKFSQAQSLLEECADVKECSSLGISSQIS